MLIFVAEKFSILVRAGNKLTRTVDFQTIEFSLDSHGGAILNSVVRSVATYKKVHMSQFLHVPGLVIASFFGKVHKLFDLQYGVNVFSKLKQLLPITESLYDPIYFSFKDRPQDEDYIYGDFWNDFREMDLDE
jgi:hypothetical protein